MNIVKPNKDFDAWYIDNFIPSAGLVRAAAESFDRLAPEWWVSYGDEGQIGKCSPASMNSITHECLLVMDYISTHFDTSMLNKEDKTFPDLTGYGGGMMITPNKNGEGGFLGMHIDAQTHKINTNWKREYSVVLGLSEDYDSSFDLRLHDGEKHCRLQYKFNRLNIFKFHENSWHGFPEITKGKDRKTIGLMYWSIYKDTTEEDMFFTKARFNHELDFA